MEQWRTVEGHGGWYEVSDLGGIRSYRKNRAYPREQLPRTLLGNNNNGYLNVLLNGKWIGVHRVVALAFLPPPIEGQVEVHHINHERGDNRAANLQWITVAENRRRRRGPGKNGYTVLKARVAELEAENARLRAQNRLEHTIANLGGVHIPVDPPTTSFSVDKSKIRER